MSTSRAARLSLVLALVAACRATDDADDDTDAVPDGEPTREGLELGPPVRCPDPSQRESLGPYATTHLARDAQTWALFEGLGVAVADFDADGRPELVLAGEETTRLLAWTPSAVTDHTDRFAAFDLSHAITSVPVDLDGDGDLDLFIGRSAALNVILSNDGRGHFTDVSARSGLQGALDNDTMNASFADIDHDGDLDVFVVNYGQIDFTGPEPASWPTPPDNRLYENVGDGVFEERTDLLPLDARAGLSFAASFLDLDDDGKWELYVTHDFGDKRVPNGLTAVDGFHVATLPSTGLEVGFESMSLAVGDLDGDGRDEVLLPAWGRLAILSQHGGLWFDETSAYGIGDLRSDHAHVGWGAAIADLDNDGAREAFFTFGYIESRDRWDNKTVQTDTLWRRDALGVWSDHAPDWGLDDGHSTRGLVVADLDGNGVLDIVRPTLDNGDILSLGRCGAGAWLNLSFAAQGANPFGVGARVRLKQGTDVWTGTVRAGGETIASGGPPELHFGLGDHDTIEQMDVRWPDGSTSTYTDIPTRRAIRVVQDGR